MPSAEPRRRLGQFLLRYYVTTLPRYYVTTLPRYYLVLIATCHLLLATYSCNLVASYYVLLATYLRSGRRADLTEEVVGCGLLPGSKEGS